MTAPKRRCKMGSRYLLGWVNLIVFLSIFYFVVFTFLIMSLVLHLQGLSSQYPYWSFGHGGTIGPGVSKIPKPRNPEEVPFYETMVYSPNDNESYKLYVDNMLKCHPGKEASKSKNFTGLSCGLQGLNALRQINATNWHNWRKCETKTFSDCEPCSLCDAFGYSTDSPCFSIGANRVLNWRPRPYPAKKLPAEMPDFLKKIYSPKCLHVTCDGDFQEIEYKAANIKNIYEITYFPDTCIPVNRFKDFFNQTCQSKSVRINFRIAPNIPVTIRCRLWAENVDYDYRLRKGTLTFTVRMKRGL